MKKIFTVLCVIAFVGAVLTSCRTKEKCPAFSSVNKVEQANS